LRALAKRPADRYQTARELQADLEAFAHAHRLMMSSLALAGYVERMARDRAVAWHRARDAGVSLVQHVTESLGTERSISVGPAGRGQEAVDTTVEQLGPRTRRRPRR